MVEVEIRKILLTNTNSEKVIVLIEDAWGSRTVIVPADTAMEIMTPTPKSITVTPGVGVQITYIDEV